MNAKSSNLGRIQEVYDLVTKTRKQIESLGISRERFVNPIDDADDLLAEGIMNRVFRITEELGHLDSEIAECYELDSRGARGIRNRLAHVYGEVDRDIVWGVIENEFEAILKGCVEFCDDIGVDLGLKE